MELKIENYSDELAFAASVCHQLAVNIGHLETSVEINECGYDVPIDSVLLVDQIKLLKQLLASAGEHFKCLLKKESSIPGIVFMDEHPFVTDYPEWISDLFPYFRPKEEDDSIISAGGSIVYNVESIDVVNEHNSIFGPDMAISGDVPDNFTTVWYPIAAGYLNPGYIWKCSDRKWLSYSLEL